MRSKGQRRIVAEWPAFDGTSPLEADIILQQNESADSMTIATPFPGSKSAFYYNQKINCLAGTGTYTLRCTQNRIHS
jgi:hypothetical protein